MLRLTREEDDIFVKYVIDDNGTKMIDETDEDNMSEFIIEAKDKKKPVLIMVQLYESDNRIVTGFESVVAIRFNIDETITTMLWNEGSIILNKVSGTDDNIVCEIIASGLSFHEGMLRLLSLNTLQQIVKKEIDKINNINILLVGVLKCDSLDIGSYTPFKIYMYVLQNGAPIEKEVRLSTERYKGVVFGNGEKDMVVKSDKNKYTEINATLYGPGVLEIKCSLLEENDKSYIGGINGY